MKTIFIAGHAGRIAGISYRTIRNLAAQIDWREVFTITVLGLVTLVLLTYEAGRVTGRAVHALNDALAREWVAACGVLERPAAPIVHPVAPIDMAPAPIDPRPVIATIRQSLPTGITLARHLVAAGHSQRQAARRAGVSRTSLHRAMAVA